MRSLILFIGVMTSSFLNYAFFNNVRLVFILFFLQIVFLMLIHYLTQKFTSNIPIEESHYRASLKKLVIVSISLLSLAILQNQVMYYLNLVTTAFMCQYIAVKNGYRLAT